MLALARNCCFLKKLVLPMDLSQDKIPPLERYRDATQRSLARINSCTSPIDDAMQVYGDSVAPYPLLIVAPDGIESYGLARAAMNSWDDQFGYELVPAGVELAFPKADPVLEDKVAAAINRGTVLTLPTLDSTILTNRASGTSIPACVAPFSSRRLMVCIAGMNSRLLPNCFLAKSKTSLSSAVKV